MSLLRFLPPPVVRAGVVAVTAGALALGACGSEDPEYCDLREEAATQIQAVRDTDVVAEGTNALTERVETALTTLEQLSDQAKEDFPEETGSLQRSANAVRGSLAQLENPDTRVRALAVLPGQLQAFADAGQRLRSSVDEECG